MTLSWLGTGFQTVALGVAVIGAGGGPRQLGLVMASSVLSMLVCVLFGGVWADRLQPTRVMVLSDLVRFAATAGITVMFAAGTYRLAPLCALVAVSSGAGSFFGPAMTALKPMLVPAERRQSANATLSLAQTGCAVLGPALGGALVAVFGAPVGFAVNAVSFLASLLAALLIRVRAERAPRTGMLRELAAGRREITSRDWLLSGVLSATLFHVANGVILVLVQVVAIERLGGASAVGLIASAEGLGGVVGAAVGLRWRPHRLLGAGWLALLLMPFWVLAYVWPGILAAVMAGGLVGYAGLSFFGVAWETTLQDQVPRAALGRVASWDQLASFLAMPVGNALAGPLSDAYGVDPVLVVCAGVLLAALAVPMLVPGTWRITRPAAAVRTPVSAAVPAPAALPAVPAALSRPVSTGR
ncbi:MFS transporter [Plantactinospora sp. KBS50]|uniref:MFS transporter n=1 Tax=Plantactinospora sp. KBS50 TaxID=2024580 RepID=UPI001E5DBA31|nr:MFS transporter [Plantactinospora sp. KBS50]